MNLPHVVSWFSLAALLAACGGTVARNEAGGARAGASHGGSSQAGESTRAGSSNVGGGVATGGSLSLGGSVGAGGAPNCATVDCATRDCAEGEVAVLEPGNCCPRCRPKAGGCEDVKCQPVQGCAEGYELAQPPGACCVGCMPKPGEVTTCPAGACLTAACPFGYVRGDVVGGCCQDCLPDPRYCRDDADCVMAYEPQACCGCPEAITRRQYEAEPCWTEVGTMRPLPKECFPEFTCDALCAPCQNLGDSAVCSEHRCIARGFGLK